VKIIFFDGYCNLCNGFIDFLIKRDQRNIFHYSSLQSKIASEKLPATLIANIDTVVYQQEDKIFLRSEAIVQILKDLGGVWKTVGVVLSLLPSLISDGVYRSIASNRYRIFGKKDSCRLPTEHEKKRFL